MHCSKNCRCSCSADLPKAVSTAQTSLSVAKNGQHQTAKKLAALFWTRNVQKGAPTIHGMHCFVGSRNKLGDTMGQIVGCVEIKPKVLVGLDALHLIAIE